MVTSIDFDEGGPNPFDLRELLSEHDRLHEALWTMAVGSEGHREASEAIDESLLALADRLTPEGVLKLFHVACELVSDATSPYRPHRVHFDQRQGEAAKHQLDFLAAYLSTHLP